jgi:ribosome-associated protein
MIDEPDESSESPSKSELKRQSRELQDLGEELVRLPAPELAAIEMPDELREAVETARRITAHGARVRQRLYIGKLLRHTDVEPIRQALAHRAERDRLRVRQEHGVEEWRTRLLADEPAAWTELGTRIAATELAELRSLARQARAENHGGRPPAAARKLFRRLRELLAPATD